MTHWHDIEMHHFAALLTQANKNGTKLRLPTATNILKLPFVIHHYELI